VDERILAHPRTPTHKPKTASCVGCRVEYPRREMVYLHQENHDDLTYFQGERMCKPCAPRNGISY
jgi:hypothetical protein